MKKVKNKCKNIKINLLFFYKMLNDNENSFRGKKKLFTYKKKYVYTIKSFHSV